MARVIVLTDDGRAVWQMEGLESWHVRGLECPGNVRGSSLAAGIRRAVEDAEDIQAGRDPERLSEKVMRLLQEERAQLEYDGADEQRDLAEERFNERLMEEE